MALRKVLLAVFVSIVGVLTAFSQDDPALDIGFKPYGSYHGGNLDSVNLSNGYLNLHIPLIDYPQRGEIGYTALIMYTNKGWNVFPNCNAQTGVCSPLWQWKGSGVKPNPDSPENFGASQGPLTKGSKFMVYRAGTSDGATHQMAVIQSGGAESLDGTDIWYDGTAFPNTGLSRNVSGALKSGPNLEDANGNIFSEPSTTLNMTDTIGRILPGPSSLTPTTDFTGCTGPLPTNSAVLYSFPGYKGATRMFKVCSASIPLQTNFQASGFYNDLLTQIAEGHPTSGSASMVQSVVIYNGSSWITSLAWTFEYNSRNPGDSTTVSYGELTKITLPTGGTISYTWTTVPTCGTGDTPVKRVVLTRTVDANDGTGPQKWTYFNNNSAVTDPSGNDTVHVFSGLGNSCSLFEVQTQYFQGSYQSGHLLKTVNTDYRWIQNPFDGLDGTAAPVPTVTNVFPTRVTTTWADGKATKIEKDYDSKLVYSDPVHGWTAASYGNVIETREYDYGNGAPGPLLRRTDYTYKAFDGSPLAPSYLAANLVNLVGSVSVYDGASNLVSLTKYGYDESSLQPSGLTAQQQRDTSLLNPGIRGNRTSESHWLNTTGAMLTSLFTYYDTGTPYQTTDPGGHVSTNIYGSGFQSGSSFVGAYVTQTKNALQQSSLFDYDFMTGLQTAVQNLNAGLSTADYDLYGRSKITIAPNQKTTNWNYVDTQPPFFTASTTISPAIPNLTSEGDLDGLGRVSHTKLTSDPEGTDTVDTTYDGVGSVSTVSNPHRATAASTDGVTTSIHDALGRVTQVIAQDGSVTTTDYSQFPIVTVTDPANNKRQSRTDALGRLVEVDEPGDPTAFVANNYGNLAQDGNFAVFGPANDIKWQTNTHGATNTFYSVNMMDDGNLIKYTPTWNTNAPTSNGTASYGTLSCVGYRLFANQTLPSGACLQSLNKRFMLAMQTDGNLVLYDLSYSPAHFIFASGGTLVAGSYLVMQGDGNLVIYTPSGTATWSTGTPTGSGNYMFQLQDPGNLVIYRDIWETGTPQPANGVTNFTPVSCSNIGPGIALNQNLPMGSCLISNNGRFALVMQTDGNLVLYDRSANPASAIWSTGTGILVTPFSPQVELQTLYFYDALGNLLCVEQHGNVSGTGCSAPASSDATSPWRVRRFMYDSLSRLLTASNPESNTAKDTNGNPVRLPTVYSYDADGNLLQKTSPAPSQQIPSITQTISYCYDALHRVTGKAYSAQSCPLTSPVVTYTYDQGTNGIGHLTHLSDQAGTGDYTYDNMGRMIGETRVINGISKSMSYDYNLDGSIKAIHYPSTAVVTYTPSSAGRMLSAVDSGNNINYATSASYSPPGSLVSLINGNSGTFAGITNTFSYNKRLQPINMSASAPSQTVFSIGYDFHLGNGTNGSDNGNVWGITNYKDNSRNQSFTYDSLNRLTSAQNVGTDCLQKTLNPPQTEYWGNSYIYDAWGNLTNKIVTKCYAENLSAGPSLVTNQLSGYGYDAAGNMTYDPTDGGITLSYDQENRTTGAGGYTYTYDADGNRVKKTNGSTGTLYWYMSPGIVAESDLNGVLRSEYAFFGGERVARRDNPGTPGATVVYYFSDHLKTTDVVTDATGHILNESDFYPWGGELKFIANDSNHYKFTGKERDETGLDYFGARYYSNGMGRFMTPDWSSTPIPVPYAEFGDPQSLNQYSYVRNLPTTSVDADGHLPALLSPHAVEEIEELIEQGAKDGAKMIARAGAAASLARVAAGAAVLYVAYASSPLVQTVGQSDADERAAMQQASEERAAENGGVDPQVSASGAGRKGGGKAYDDTPENLARMAQGKPPIGKDGKPVELHSPDQTHKDQSQELTRADHRGKGNFKKNHTNTGQQPSLVNRNQAARDRRSHWKKTHMKKTKTE